MKKQLSNIKRKIEVNLMLSTFLLLNCFLISNIYSQEKDVTAGSCFKCHSENENMPDDFKNFDVHFKSGIGCSDCHGEDSKFSDEDEAMDSRKGFVGSPSHSSVPKLCGKCHSNISYMRKYKPRMNTDQVEQYYTSVHGKQLLKGDKNVAICTSCHSAHSILPADDARSTTYAINIPNTCHNCHSNPEIMSNYNLPTDQFDKYKQSVHGEALLVKLDTGSPACNDCHGNHGATPPGVNSIAHICGNCHVNNMELFLNSRMGEAFAEEELHACSECHNYHDVFKTNDEMLNPEAESVCSDCHDDDEGSEANKKIYASITKLTSIYDSLETKLFEVKMKGMNDSEIEYKMKAINQKIITSRTQVHSFSPELVDSISSLGYKEAQEANVLANNELAQFDFRRVGFLYASIIFFVLIILIFFKIKAMRKN